MEDLTIDQLTLLKDIYYDKKLFFGRDKLYRYLRDNHEDANISRRQLYLTTQDYSRCLNHLNSLLSCKSKSHR